MTLGAVVQAAQIAAPIVAAVAAVASWRSASASLRTAGRADETSRRAVEALGRATMPLLTVTFSGDSARFLDRGPLSVSLDVVNYGSNRGLLIAAGFRRSDGVTGTTTAPMPQVIGSTTPPPYEESHALSLPLGEMSRLLPDVQADLVDSDVVITTEVVFADASRVVTWRLRGRWVEQAQMSANGRPNYSYVQLEESEPEIVSDMSRTEDRSVGWVRRTWRRFW
ncbi:MAG: hypothetical protein ACR2GH_07635 [Pseudonocardia sp.]